MKLGDLSVPVNPDYDWNKGPETQAEYVNPVTLNNRQVQWINAAIEVTREHIRLNKQLGERKAELSKVRFDLEDLEQELLLAYPPSTTATKSLKLLQQYVFQTAVTASRSEELKRLTGEIRRLETEIQKLEIEIDNCRQIYQMLKLAGEHGQTHLSFVKQEARKVGLFS